MVKTLPSTTKRPRRMSRPLFCPEHTDQRISGNGRRYFLHLLTPEELRQQGMSERTSRLVIEHYPVLVLHNEWLEELYCPTCGNSRWCHVVKQVNGTFLVRRAPINLWEQVAHVDPLMSNPSVGEFTHNLARAGGRRRDCRRWFDPHI